MDIHKAGLLTLRDNRILLCRKNKDTDLLILPGGKFDGEESAQECLEREIAEEVGSVSIQNPEYIATYSDKAAGNLSKTVQIELYKGDLVGVPIAQAEIAELIWFGPEDDRALLSPVLANRIVPDLIARKILDWAA